jgi:hypothetical protein
MVFAFGVARVIEIASLPCPEMLLLASPWKAIRECTPLCFGKSAQNVCESRANYDVA